MTCYFTIMYNSIIIIGNKFQVRNPGYAHFSKKRLRGHVRTISGNMLVKFEVCSFNRFGAIGIYLQLATSPPSTQKWSVRSLLIQSAVKPRALMV